MPIEKNNLNFFIFLTISFFLLFFIASFHIIYSEINGEKSVHSEYIYSRAKFYEIAERGMKIKFETSTGKYFKSVRYKCLSISNEEEENES